jgi:hypothetical protein
LFTIISWVAVLIGAALAAFQVAEVHRAAVSAPQQAAGAGLALAYVIIPYCFARAVESLSPQTVDPEVKSAAAAPAETTARPRYPAGPEGWRKLMADAEKQGWVASTTLAGVSFRHTGTGRVVKASRIEDAVVELDLRA